MLLASDGVTIGEKWTTVLPPKIDVDFFYSVHKILPYPSTANFTTRTLLRRQNFQNTTLPISAQCAVLVFGENVRFYEIIKLFTSPAQYI